MTRLIVVLCRAMGVDKAIALLVGQVLQQQNQQQIVDLGSGAGGVMPQVLEALRQQPGMEQVQLTMTDLYPNPDAVKLFNQPEQGLHYNDKPVDATHLASAPTGLKTMVNCFHHMPPPQARGILESAQRNGQPLLIFELSDNKLPLLLWVLLLPLSLAILMVMVLFMTPFVKPLTWQQVVFTYLIPIIPICYAWDGQASLPRMYSMGDFDQLLNGLSTDSYTWEKGPALDAKGKAVGIYVLGRPV